MNGRREFVNIPRDRASIDRACTILRERFGERFQSGQSVREQHGHTTTLLVNQPPDAVIYARSTNEVIAIVNVCREHRVPIIPFGAGTSLEGHLNAPVGGVSVDLTQMNRIVAINASDLDVVVQPGVTRRQLNASLRDTGLFFPVDPGADATLGGMASTRASGTNAVRYGTMRDNVLALEVVMSRGQCIRTGSRAKKSAAGYDLTRLLIGAEGTLGIITELTLRLAGVPEAIASARCSFASVEAACDAAMTTVQHCIPVARMELLDALSVSAVNAYSGTDLPEAPLLLLEFHASKRAVAEQCEVFGDIAAESGGVNYSWTLDEAERAQLWRARHDAYWATLRLRPGAKALSTDICVPISRLAECVAAAQGKAAGLGLVAPIVGHVGDGNFHMLPLIDTDNAAECDRLHEFIGWLAELAIHAGGTCSGEHGIGQGKRRYMKAEVGDALDSMVEIKGALDPSGIMNPGKILP